MGQQAVQTFRDPGGLAGQVVVEAADHLQFGDGLVLAVDGPQCVGIARAASAMMKASFASVLASPG